MAACKRCMWLSAVLRCWLACGAVLPCMVPTVQGPRPHPTSSCRLRRQRGSSPAPCPRGAPPAQAEVAQFELRLEPFIPHGTLTLHSAHLLLGLACAYVLDEVLWGHAAEELREMTVHGVQHQAPDTTLWIRCSCSSASIGEAKRQHMLCAVAPALILQHPVRTPASRA